MVYGNFKDLAKRTATDKFLRDKAFNIAKDPRYDGYQRGLAAMVYKFFEKKTAGSGIKSMLKTSVIWTWLCNNQLKSFINIIRKFKKRIVYSTCKDSICGADLADMQ